MSQDVHGIRTHPQATFPYGGGYITSRECAFLPPRASVLREEYVHQPVPLRCSEECPPEKGNQIGPSWRAE
jgi:hypothetical protein